MSIKTLNKMQVTELFEKEAVFFGVNDGVPVHRATELFGEKAAKFGIGEWSKDWSNGFSIAGNDVQYLTFKGFQKAAGYANAETLCKNHLAKAVRS